MRFDEIQFKETNRLPNGLQARKRNGDMMSIAMEHFGSSEQFSEYDASSALQSPAFPYHLQCRTCGFEPLDVITPPPRCPKCMCHSWERFAFPRSLLMSAACGPKKRRSLE
jgi:predicted Zn-ribbon and HTH transcriptional regulator